MSIECTTSANKTVTCLYSAGPVAWLSGVPHSLQKIGRRTGLRAAGNTSPAQVPGQSTVAIPAAVHVSIVSPPVNDVLRIGRSHR